jgi:hypothetical protein
MIKVKNDFYEEFKKYILNMNTPKTFHFYKFGLCIISPVTGIEDIGSGLEIKIDGGNVTIWDDSLINKVSRPANLIRECENCYSLTNEYGEPIGYVYN